jgi:hypothetical protein
MENSMKLMNDMSNPQLVGMITDIDDLENTARIVNNLNKDLMDSGFDQYQYQTVRRGDKIYIEKK